MAKVSVAFPADAFGHVAGVKADLPALAPDLKLKFSVQRAGLLEKRLMGNELLLGESARHVVFLRSKQDAKIIIFRTDEAELPPSLQNSQHQVFDGSSSNDKARAREIARRMKGEFLSIASEKLFISYARRNDASVNALITTLDQCDFRPYTDREFVQRDRSFASDILDAIADSAAVCFISSKTRTRHATAPAKYLRLTSFLNPWRWSSLMKPL